MSRPPSDLPRLTPATVLQRAPEFTMQVFSNGHVEISRAGQTIVTDHHTLAALNAFSQPTSLAAALEALHSRITDPNVII